jgi:hypothetical protein
MGICAKIAEVPHHGEVVVVHVADEADLHGNNRLSGAQLIRIVLSIPLTR